MSNLKKFLQKSKECVNNFQRGGVTLPHNQCIHILIGNQACDADSMISSICYAYLKDSLLMNLESELHNIYLPIMAISRNDIHFRREVKILLQLVDLNFDDLICFDECPMDQFQNRNSLSFTLMDHNYMSSHLHSCYSSLVTEIVDHHEDQGYYPSVQGADRLIAFNSQMRKAEVGSSCTLVAERLLHSNILDADLATLLLGVISLE
jgi:exopolyphosphatase